MKAEDLLAGVPVPVDHPQFIAPGWFAAEIRKAAEAPAKVRLLLDWPRRTGKSTLVEGIVQTLHGQVPVLHRIAREVLAEPAAGDTRLALEQCRERVGNLPADGPWSVRLDRAADALIASNDSASSPVVRLRQRAEALASAWRQVEDVLAFRLSNAGRGLAAVDEWNRWLRLGPEAAAELVVALVDAATGPMEGGAPPVGLVLAGAAKARSFGPRVAALFQDGWFVPTQLPLVESQVRAVVVDDPRVPEVLKHTNGHPYLTMTLLKLAPAEVNLTAVAMSTRGYRPDDLFQISAAELLERLRGEPLRVHEALDALVRPAPNRDLLDSGICGADGSPTNHMFALYFNEAWVLETRVRFPRSRADLAVHAYQKGTVLQLDPRVAIALWRLPNRTRGEQALYVQLLSAAFVAAGAVAVTLLVAIGSGLLVPRAYAERDAARFVSKDLVARQAGLMAEIEAARSDLRDAKARQEDAEAQLQSVSTALAGTTDDLNVKARELATKERELESKRRAVYEQVALLKNIHSDKATVAEAYQAEILRRTKLEGDLVQAQSAMATATAQFVQAVQAANQCATNQAAAVANAESTLRAATSTYVDQLLSCFNPNKSDSEEQACMLAIPKP